MPRKIRELVARRADLGTFLVHLTRETDKPSDEQLATILRNWKLEARSAFGQARKRLERRGLSTDSQRCVCFTETPLEMMHLLVGEIEGRDCQLEPFGIGITKKVGRGLTVNPVWYLDISPGHDWLTVPMNLLIDQAIDAGDFDETPVAKLAPFVEQMGSKTTGPLEQRYRKEFWWEREWRCNGDLHLPNRVLVICPESRFSEFRAIVAGLDVAVEAAFIDAAWGLEQIIARLAGFGAEEVDVL